MMDLEPLIPASYFLLEFLFFDRCKSMGSFPYLLMDQAKKTNDGRGP